MDEAAYHLDDIYLNVDSKNTHELKEPVLEPWTGVADRLSALVTRIDEEISHLSNTLVLALQSAVGSREFTDRLALADHSTLCIRGLLADARNLTAELCPKLGPFHDKWQPQLGPKWTLDNSKQFLKNLPDKQARKNQQSRFVKDIKQLLLRFGEAQEKYKAAVKTRLTSIYQLEHPNADVAQVQKYVSDVMDSSGSSLSSAYAAQAALNSEQQQWLLTRSSALQEHYDEKQRREEISRISDTINELADLMLSMDTLLAESDEVIAKVDSQVVGAHDDLKSGSTQITKAITHRRRARRMAWIICILVLLLIVVVVIVLYFTVIKPNIDKKNSSPTTSSPSPV